MLVLAAPLPDVSLPAFPRGCEVVLHDCAGDEAVAALVESLDPRNTYRLASGADQEHDVGRIGRRLAGQAVGLVLSAGGARGFAHLGAIEELLAAGIVIDRVGGTSMGAFIGGLLAQGKSIAEVDALCYEEWVRGRPLSDYRVPKVSLLRGERARMMIDRNFPGTIEHQPLSFYAASTDMVRRAARGEPSWPAGTRRRREHGRSRHGPCRQAQRQDARRRGGAQLPSRRADARPARGPGDRLRHGRA